MQGTVARTLRAGWNALERLAAPRVERMKVGE
jgi:hypothetical protein